MLSTREKYRTALREVCSEIKLDFFPQVEASELLYRVITLEDIYLPLSLQAQPYNTNTLEELDSLPIDLDGIVEKINERIARFSAVEESSSEGVIDSSGAVTKLESDSIIPPAINNIGKPARKGLYLLIAADPGGGKTTFCKRLTLAVINNDDAFFNKYYEENKIRFDCNSFPLLIDCKDLSEIQIDSLKSQNYLDVLYYLSLARMGNHAPNISKDEFVDLLLGNHESRILIVLDGWDEILDPDKASLFQAMVNQFANENPLADIVITIRKSYIGPRLSGHYTRLFSIKPLTSEDVKMFCDNWQQVILNSNTISAREDFSIADQIIQSQEAQIQLMRRNPLELSLLLVVSKSDGKLPKNKAILFERLVDLYIYWSTIKSKQILSIKSIRVLLEYIAAYFTKHRILLCTCEELESIISQCIIDLEWAFEDNIRALQIADIISVLAHSGVLTHSYAGRGYSFFEGGSEQMHAHRQMQEYLTACAILSQYADEEYNSMNPVDILEQHFNNPIWKEVIIFVALIASKDNGRVSQELVKRLLERAKAANEDDFRYKDLLFDLVVSGAGFRVKERHEIYDIVFADHITDHQMQGIIILVSYLNNYSADFISYIENRFVESIGAGKTKYGYAKAIIYASLTQKAGASPLTRAESLIQANDEVGIIIGATILLLFARCKYSKIHNTFENYYSQYHMSISCISAIRKKLFHDYSKQTTTTILKCIREVIIAEFAAYTDFFSFEDAIVYATMLETDDGAEEAELALSATNIFSNSFRPIDMPERIKMKYLANLRDQVKAMKFDEIVFTFCLCAAINCWNSSSIEENWEKMISIYHRQKADGSIGRAFFAKLNETYYQKKQDNWKSIKQSGRSKMLVSHRVTQKPSMSVDDHKIRVYSENGEPIDCDILLTFDNEETGKSYVVYTDGELDDKGQVQVYASIYHLESGDLTLEGIEDENEWRMIDIILQTLQEDIQDNL